MMNQLNNPNNDQNIERQPHFKNVFNSPQATNSPPTVSNSSNNSSKVLNSVEIVSSISSKRPSLVSNNSNASASSATALSNTAARTNDDQHTSSDSILTTTGPNPVSITPLASGSNPHTSSTNPAEISNSLKLKSRLNAVTDSKILKPSSSRKFRSRSLPNIHIPSKHSQRILLDFQKHGQIYPTMKQHVTINHHQQKQKLGNKQFSQYQHPHFSQQQAQQNAQQMLLLPPVNLQSMHEIDLQEVLKNPQLRHDILFDPQLQFRPNLDGERGKRKRIQSENYWNMIKNEVDKLMNSNDYVVDKSNPILIMFDCLKSILMSLIPSKDIESIEEILDSNLLIQQLNSKSFNFLGFSDWICSIFKLHCAPMRDSWVDDLNNLFHKACLDMTNINLGFLVESLKNLFSILEAMKLDVANHQIRILRPLLCSYAVSFEKEYFSNAIKKNKINFTMSLLWFKKNSIILNSKNSKEILNYSILNLLSCSNMCSQFPNTLNFDHTRLILLRADIRHIVCTKLCFILYKTMVAKYNLSKELLENDNLLAEKTELLNIVVDSNGNSKWTKNLKNLSIHLVNKLFNNLDNDKIDFCYNWLLKQTQPNSKVYSLLESKLFQNILPSLSLNTPSNTGSNTNTPTQKSNINDDIVVTDELRNIVDRLNQLIDFNHNVFHEMYSSYLN